jgi:Ring finger domain
VRTLVQVPQSQQSQQSSPIVVEDSGQQQGEDEETRRRRRLQEEEDESLALALRLQEEEGGLGKPGDAAMAAPAPDIAPGDGPAEDDDEAFARRLQEEMDMQLAQQLDGGGGGGGGSGSGARGGGPSPYAGRLRRSRGGGPKFAVSAGRRSFSSSSAAGHPRRPPSGGDDTFERLQHHMAMMEAERAMEHGGMSSSDSSDDGEFGDGEVAPPGLMSYILTRGGQALRNRFGLEEDDFAVQRPGGGNGGRRGRRRHNHRFRGGFGGFGGAGGGVEGGDQLPPHLLAALENPDDPNNYDALMELGELIGDVGQKGADNVTIDRLPTRVVTAAMVADSGDLDEPGADSGEKNCLICLEDFAAGEELRTLPCFHSFHRPCADHWLREKKVCPICRASIEEEEPGRGAGPDADFGGGGSIDLTD